MVATLSQLLKLGSMHKWLRLVGLQAVWALDFEPKWLITGTPEKAPRSSRRAPRRPTRGPGRPKRRPGRLLGPPKTLPQEAGPRVDRGWTGSHRATRAHVSTEAGRWPLRILRRRSCGGMHRPASGAQACGPAPRPSASA